jgi:molybdate transport system ATP-binding protein
MASGLAAMTGSETSADLVVELTTVVGDFVLDASLRVSPGETLAVLGPNGSGKSTLLQAIAGHLEPTTGFVRVGDRELSRAASRSRYGVALDRRRVGLLSQHSLLFPHLSALENVAFGPRAQGERAGAARQSAHHWLGRVGLSGSAARRPSALSGGQQQRVALARTLAARPRVLLLDEPFASLDVQSAADMRSLLAERPWPGPLPTVLVTHDPLDAIVLAQRAAVLHAGRIVQQGTTAEVLGHPETPFVAALAGVNLVAGVGDSGGGVLADSGAPLLLHGAGAPATAGMPASAVFSPGAVHVMPAIEHEPATSAPNRWRGTVATLRPVPGGVRIGIAEHPALAVDVPSAAAVSLDLTTGARLEFSIPATEVSVRNHA